MPAGVEKLEGRWIRRTPCGVNGNIDFDQTTIHAEHYDGGCSHIRTRLHSQIPC
jgi:hypothetical protein